MRIEDFKANFIEGAKPTLYTVEIQGLPEKLKFLCKIAQLPGRTITPIEVPTPGGHIVKLAGDSVFEELTVTITVDIDFAVRKDIEDWMEDMRNADSSGGQEPSIYKKEATIIQYDSKDNEIASYGFYGLWPTTIDPIELGFESKDTIEEFGCTFSYDYWKRLN